MSISNIIYLLCPHFHPTFISPLNTTQTHATKDFQPRKRFSLFCYIHNTCNNGHAERRCFVILKYASRIRFSSARFSFRIADHSKFPPSVFMGGGASPEANIDVLIMVSGDSIFTLPPVLTLPSETDRRTPE